MSSYKLSVLEEKERRNASDAISHRNIVAVVYVTLAYYCLARILCRNLINYRSDSLAWTAPCCPEVNKYRLVCIQSLREIRVSYNICHNYVFIKKIQSQI